MDDDFSLNPVSDKEHLSTKGDEWIIGWQLAEKEFYSCEDPVYPNPFKLNSEAYNGFEEAVYTFTQK